MVLGWGLIRGEGLFEGGQFDDLWYKTQLPIELKKDNFNAGYQPRTNAQFNVPNDLTNRYDTLY